MPARLSLLFSVTTTVENPSVSVAHSGGWSESHWSNTLAGITLPSIESLCAYRAFILSQSATITGYRIQDFTISGNKLLPLSSSSGRVLFPGGSLDTVNMPQDGLSIYMSTVGAPNVSRQVLRGMPDYTIVAGEFAPNAGYLSRVNQYMAWLVSAGWKFVGRDRSVANSRVMGINAGVVTLAGPVGGVANTSFLRLNRVTDSNGNPVTGTFPITAIAGALYTVTGLAGVTVTVPSGTARIDQLAVFSYGAGRIGRSVVRKIGRPFEQYRGRASKSRA